MPDRKTHSFLTSQALKLQKKDMGNCKDLIEEYSSYPDFYFSDRWKELEKYNFFLDDIQFHYLPDTPYNELYRYWKMREDGGFLSRGFVNENFRHAEAGFTFYLTESVKNFKNGESEEAKKYLGCLLHMLEDATFGFHTLEGAGGADGFVLDRMMDCNPSPADILAKIKMDFSLPCPDYEPQNLGNSIDESVMMLYGEYCKYSSDSRKAAFEYVLSEIKNSGSDGQMQIRRMYENAVKICADVIKTVLHLSSGEKIERKETLLLTQLEPYQFPFGGFGSYRFRSFLRDRVIYDGKYMPLLLNDREIVSGISFGAHFRGSLRYKISPDTFRSFSVQIGLQSQVPGKGNLEIEWINDGKVVEKINLSAGKNVQTLTVNAPCGEFGLDFHGTRQCGIIVLGEPQFEYCS